MGRTLTEKIIKNHLLEGEMVKGENISIRIDQTLTQDATGTMAYLELEQLGIEKVKTEISVSYVDHNTLQSGFENADDHKYLQTVADKYGIYYSKAGNGICHQVHLERFSKPGKTLLGSDSHTPTSGGMGMLAIGAGGLDVALAMAGEGFTLVMPKIVNIELRGKLKKGVSAKDIILEVLRMLTVKGGVNKVIEYSGEGIKSLSVPERATITNMGAELGATSSIFPSDEVTLEFLKMQKRESDFVELEADKDAIYDEKYIIDLSLLTPLAAMPHSPDKVAGIETLSHIKVDQVLIGSCTNSSYYDLMKAASIIKGKKIHKDVSLGIVPGSKQVLEMITRDGILEIFIQAGARILESACGACIGMGMSPATDAVSLRTFNRNFYGRSGTLSAKVYLVSPETAISSAIKGFITNDSNFNEMPMPKEFIIDDSMIIAPTFKDVIVRGPNIKPLFEASPLEKTVKNEVILKLDDNITTDDIMPAGSKVLPYRSNIDKISEFVFNTKDPNFKARALELGGSIVVAGHNYGQGSSREHAAIAPKYLGVKAVITKSFARIHRKNLINFGILPFVFVNEEDYNKIFQKDILEINTSDIIEDKTLLVKNISKNFDFEVSHNLDKKEIEIIKAGGMLKFIKNLNKK
ncbi:MAG: aconitate hydratase [Bacilli bacterium]